MKLTSKVTVTVSLTPFADIQIAFLYAKASYVLDISSV